MCDTAHHNPFVSGLTDANEMRKRMVLDQCNCELTYNSLLLVDSSSLSRVSILPGFRN